MKKTLLLLATAIGICTVPHTSQAGNHHGDSDTGLLDGIACRKFTGNGLTQAHIEGVSDINMRSNFGSIDLSGVGWTFETSTIAGTSICLNGSLTIVGSNGGQLYALDFTKNIHGRHKQLCLIAVRAIPEVSMSALLLGLVAFAFTTTRRK
jgi:hypothetical protein